ncbi:MAG: hypothetical protein ACREKL_06870 [Chthoniobacterales bacterium]
MLPPLGGCAFVHPKAKTVLTFQAESCGVPVPVGFDDVKWTGSGGRLEIAGYGWHPRAHETYGILLSEPFPVSIPRFLIVEGTGEECAIRVRWTHGGAPCHPGFSGRVVEYSGRMPGVRVRPGRSLKLTLRNVPMATGADGPRVLVSGRIYAEAATAEEVEELARRAKGKP